ncbi:alpha/beta fold hydrolase [Limnobacter litoralis]|uniref:Proline iminopeptidase n=1 Tax=Limnobacter litoralis TaxID=481366 RepID=A0ABQ5YPA0_9BURK|nr:alpha/beta fold hydrolase [Limnobacter litoralis]GLR26418.1 proline iminopeptidase [Limnobacter litoralis]
MFCTFGQIARPPCGADRAAYWTEPAATMDFGGNLAVWAEHGMQESTSRPWLVLHGGPGGRLSAAQIAPLRANGVPWFGFDQRNSGLSEDLDLNCVDTQRLLDDALSLADALGIEQFHVLAGSWGAFLALLLAADCPDRIASLVLRAPFLPLQSRVDAFFHQLEAQDPDRYNQWFGKGAHTHAVCQRLLSAPPEDQLEMCRLWSQLENQLLSVKTASKAATSTGGNQDLLLVRKYRLQAHFLLHDCFVTPNFLNEVGHSLSLSGLPVTIVQGLMDTVCPPGGARFLSELLPGSNLIELSDTGHLAESGRMTECLSRAVLSHSSQ